jgi:archaellum component FlaF (FlaF/FlaG flagellin family)
VEKFRDEQLARAKNVRGIYDLDAEVKDISPEKVYFLLDISQPGTGLLLQVDIGGKGGRGLHKGSPEAYSLGEKVHLRLQYQQKGSHTKLDELPKEIEDILGVQRVFTNLAWEAGTLTFQGRMSYSTYKELAVGSTSPKYRRAVKDLYRYSNMLWGETVDENIDKKAIDKYPVGTTVNKATISQMVSTGGLVELEQGIKGLLRIQDMTQEVKPGDTISVTVRKIEGAQRISLIMGKKYFEKTIIPQSKTPMVIGRGGGMIKSIMEQTHTNIDNLNVGTQTEFYIFGDTLNDVQQAKSRIESIAHRY